ncbi:MAG: MFS transporter [Planctomycetota bacterium]
MRHVTTAWLFGVAWLHLTMGATLTRFAKLMGLPTFWFGVLAAMPFAGALMQFPSSYVISRYGHRKRLLLTFGMISRLTWVGIALIPWVLPGAWWWPMLMVLRACSSLSGHAMSPAVMTWFADLIPRRIRGRYFSRRNQLARLVAVVTTLVAGTVLDYCQRQGEAALLRAVSALLAVGGVVGTIDFLWLFAVPEVAHRPNRRQRFWHLFREPLRDRNFRHFLGYTATVTLGMGFIGQFVWLYVFDVLRLGNRAANIMLAAVPLVVGYFAVRGWGHLLDRLGVKPTLEIAALLVVPGAAAWILVTPEHWWLGYCGVLLSIVGWSGVELANFNFLLGMGASRKGQRQGSGYLAVNSVVVSTAGILSGLLGGTVASWLEGWEGSLLGQRVTYHGVLFLISGALRLAALGWLIGMREPQAQPTRAAVRYIAVNIYSNVRQGLFMPVRRIARLGRLAYVLSKRRAARRARQTRR